MANYTTSEIEMAINDLYGIDAGKHRNSAEFSEVLKAAKALNDLVKVYYSRSTGLTQPDLDALRGAYARLDTACDKYTQDKGTSRVSGYGEARLHCVNEIARIAKLDHNALLSPAGLGHHLSDVISCARATTVSVTDRDSISTVGDALSSRMPLNVVGSHQQRDGFFTAEKTLSAQTEIEELVGFYKDDREFAPIFEALRRDPAGMYSIVNAAYVSAWNDIYLSLTRSGIEVDYNDHEEIMGGDLSSIEAQLAAKGKDPNDLLGDISDTLKEKAQAAGLFAAVGDFDTAILDDTQKLDLFASVLTDTFSEMRSFSVSACAAGIPVGQDISKRNIGMSRVADMLGLKGLVARTDSMKVELGGEFKRGVFMEKVTGSDISRLKADDPLLTGDVDETSVNTGDLKRSLADLQVLDYLCGNIDRHTGNMLYQASESHGHASVSGIIGIDNDCSFGVIMGDETEARNWGVVPKDMMVMSKKTAAAIMALEPDDLKIALQDLGFTTTGDAAHPGEMEALASRLDALKQYIATKGKSVDYVVGIEPEEGSLLLLDDAAFSAVDIRALSKPDPKNPDREVHNYFTRALSMVQEVNELKPERLAELAEEARPDADAKKSKTISYTATEKKWDYSLNRGEITLDSMEDAATGVTELKKRLKDADPFYHRNSGSFRWMKEALEKLDKKTSEYAKRAQTGSEGAKLTEDEVKELEELYREVNKAAANYYSQHEGERKTDLGSDRQDLAADLFVLRPPYKDEPAAPTAAAEHEKKKVPYRTMVAAPSKATHREHKSASKVNSRDAVTPDTPGSK